MNHFNIFDLFNIQANMHIPGDNVMILRFTDNFFVILSIFILSTDSFIKPIFIEIELNYNVFGKIWMEFIVSNTIVQEDSA